MHAYIVTNLATGMRYVGITSNTVKRRWQLHLSNAARGVPTPLYRAIRKYGSGAFLVEHVASAQNWRMLCELERALIDQEGTFFPGGYNLTRGGDGACGYKATPEARAALARRNRECSATTREKRRAATLRLWETRRDFMMDSMKSRTWHFSQESRKKIAEAGRNRAPISESERHRRVSAATGRKHSQETRAKIADAHRALPPRSPEWCAAISKGRSGLRPTAEVRAKMSESQKSSWLARRVKSLVWGGDAWTLDECASVSASIAARKEAA